MKRALHELELCTPGLTLPLLSESMIVNSSFHPCWNSHKPIERQLTIDVWHRKTEEQTVNMLLCDECTPELVSSCAFFWRIQSSATRSPESIGSSVAHLGPHCLHAKCSNAQAPARARTLWDFTTRNVCVEILTRGQSQNSTSDWTTP